MQRVSSQAKAADLHSSDIQAELRHQQELVEERDAEIRRLQKVTCLFVIQLALCILPFPACSFSCLILHVSALLLNRFTTVVRPGLKSSAIPCSLLHITHS